MKKLLLFIAILPVCLQLDAALLLKQLSRKSIVAEAKKFDEFLKESGWETNQAYIKRIQALATFLIIYSRFTYMRVHVDKIQTLTEQAHKALGNGLASLDLSSQIIAQLLGDKITGFTEAVKEINTDLINQVSSKSDNSDKTVIEFLNEKYKQVMSKLTRQQAKENCFGLDLPAEIL